MGGVHDRAMNHVMQWGQMTPAMSNPTLPPCFIASTGAAMLEHTQQCPQALTSVHQLMDQPAAT